MKDFNTIALYACPMEPSPTNWQAPGVALPVIVNTPKPPQETTQDIKHTSHALLRLYGLALEGAKPEHHNEILEHFRTIGKALGVL